MFEAIDGAAGFAGLAEQEGGLGLVAADLGDDFVAEFSYRRAVDLATAAKAWSSVNTWAGNLGNALTRDRSVNAPRAWNVAPDVCRELLVRVDHMFLECSADIAGATVAAAASSPRRCPLGMVADTESTLATDPRRTLRRSRMQKHVRPVGLRMAHHRSAASAPTQ